MLRESLFDTGRTHIKIAVVLGAAEGIDLGNGKKRPPPFVSDNFHEEMTRWNFVYSE